MDSDFKLVEQLYEVLKAKGLEVFFDKKTLELGIDWEVSFIEGLIHSRTIICAISKKALKARFENMTSSNDCDNVLLEHRIALELKERGYLELIIPLLIGDLDPITGSYSHYFNGTIDESTGNCVPYKSGEACCPEWKLSSSSTVVVESVEKKLIHHLETQGLGTPLLNAPTIQEIYVGITKNQGVFVERGGFKVAERGEGGGGGGGKEMKSNRLDLILEGLSTSIVSAIQRLSGSKDASATDCILCATCSNVISGVVVDVPVI